MADSDLIKLYSGRILELAAAIPLAQRLENPQASVKKRSPLCGSTVAVDLDVEYGRVVRFGQDVKACALGQAAAAIVGKNVIGTDRVQIVAGRDALKAMLKEDGPTPPAPFEELEILRPAKDYRNRHASILLTLEALTEAMDRVDRSDCA